MKQALFIISVICWAIYAMILSKSDVAGFTFLILGWISAIGGMIVEKIDKLRDEIRRKK